MGIQEWSDDIILVNLAKEPQLGEELQATIDMIAVKSNHDVVIDFGDVEIITSSSIAKLLKVRKALSGSGRRVVLSSVSTRTKKVFSLIGLDSVFEFVDDQFVALAGLQMVD